ncbi:MAG: class I SAM-dependent methyltransferase [Syntrophorhabdaceae bacterium]|nr:class I SAM-dependent methyltransferase [Syntrophorhabdaceae bacterium]
MLKIFSGKIKKTLFVATLSIAVIICILSGFSYGEQRQDTQQLNEQVSQFLKSKKYSWDYLNVPYEDGEILYNLVLKGKHKKILEIGTSTGHSTIWLAWAAAKNGGKVTTIEINKERRTKALDNFRKAGVAQYIEALLGDARIVVRELKGPFDFVFCDADKEWYLQYFLDLEEKIDLGGCYTAHNVLRSYSSEVDRFLEYVKRHPKFKTTIIEGSGEGISVSCRTAR